MFRGCRLLNLLRTRALLDVRQGSTGHERPEFNGFYDELTYENEEFPTLKLDKLKVELLPFQTQGVSWMIHREKYYGGGIMADHLGMGKTVQMIALCLNSENAKIASEPPTHASSKRFKLITVLRQLQRISAIGNCSSLNRPGEEIYSLLAKLDDEKVPIDTSEKEVSKWLNYAQKFHPLYVARARLFIENSMHASIDSINTSELRTLVVVPASLMIQWQKELKSKSTKTHSIVIYHGSVTKDVDATELESNDFVITTYDTLVHDARHAFSHDTSDGMFDRAECGPVFQIRWKRIILDEAHVIRNANTMRSRVIRELDGLKKWAVTATPLHNTIEDMQSLLQFIGSPKLPIVAHQDSDTILRDSVLQRSIARSLQPLMLRRGPVMHINGVRKVLVELPPLLEEVCYCELTTKESEQYNEILSSGRSRIASEEKKSVLSMFAMMTRLRQTCCHHWIINSKLMQTYLCELCRCEASHPVHTKCGHAFCYECLMNKFKEASSLGGEDALRIGCPSCNNVVRIRDLKGVTSRSSHEHILQLRKRGVQHSSKTAMAMSLIRRMYSDFPGDKMVIFSHFTTFLDVLEVLLSNEGVEYCRLDGSMTLKTRAEVMEQFHKNSHKRVMLASKTAIGVGLNLTIANHVVVVDPWWNPAIEEQAVHRCHRIGQDKPVIVKRLIVSDSIEQYCYEICQKKREFGKAILNAAIGATSETHHVSRVDELFKKLSFVKPIAKDTPTESSSSEETVKEVTQ